MPFSIPPAAPAHPVWMPTSACRSACPAPSCCSQCVQAAQITFEDFFMADLAIPPLKIVGYEGVLGAATMLLLVLPIVQRLPGTDGQGLHEDSVDTIHVSHWLGWGYCYCCPLLRQRRLRWWQRWWCAVCWQGMQRASISLPVLNWPSTSPPTPVQMITHSTVIATVLAVDALALLLYNVSGMCVTGHLGAVFRQAYSNQLTSRQPAGVVDACTEALLSCMQYAPWLKRPAC